MFFFKHRLKMTSLRIGKHRIVKNIASLRKVNIAHLYWRNLILPSIYTYLLLIHLAWPASRRLWRGYRRGSDPPEEETSLLHFDIFLVAVFAVYPFELTSDIFRFSLRLVLTHLSVQLQGWMISQGRAALTKPIQSKHKRVLTRQSFAG